MFIPKTFTMKELFLTSKVQPPIEGLPYITRNRVVAIIKHPKEDSFLLIKDWYGITFPWWWVEKDELFEDAIKREIKEETGYINIDNIKQSWIVLNFYRNHGQENWLSKNIVMNWVLNNLERKESEFEILWIEKEQVYKTLETESSKLLRKTFLSNQI